MRKAENAIREAVADMFDVLSYKVRNGVMTEQDLRAISAVIREAGGVQATIKDLASFYGQSEDNVRHVISRHFMPSPSRRVYYDFDSFRQFVPEKWHERHSLPAD